MTDRRDKSGQATAGTWPDELYMELDQPPQDTSPDNLTTVGIKRVMKAVTDTDIAIFNMMQD